MPELPEVETVVRGLSHHIPSQTIKGIEISNASSFLWSKDVADPSVIIGLKVLSLSRRGKGIIINLTKGYCLLIHLKMTGQLIYINKTHKVRINSGHPDANFLASMPSRHTRCYLILSGGTLYFNDQRKFGWVKLTRTELLANDPFIRKLGPEPLDKTFTPEILWQAIQRRPRSNIKSIILDQSIVVGVGNIYADESLYLAKIRPARLGRDIAQTEVQLLTQTIKAVLRLGIKHSGTSISHFRDGTGASGKMQDYLNTYGRTGLPCPDCKQPIQKIRTAGRGTHFCAHCQT